MKYLFMAGIALFVYFSNGIQTTKAEGLTSYHDEISARKRYVKKSYYKKKKYYVKKRYHYKKRYYAKKRYYQPRRYYAKRTHLIRGASNSVGSAWVAKAGGTVIGGRPSGCPAAYCGCASARMVGLTGSKWWLAANWLGLPRAAPAPMMAAARRGHVFILLSHVSGTNWYVYDPNSGGGLTRKHVRSIAGYTIVNPRGSG